MPISIVMLGYIPYPFRCLAKVCTSLVLAIWGDATFGQTVSHQLSTPPAPDQQYAHAMAAMQGSLDRQQNAIRNTMARFAATRAAVRPTNLGEEPTSQSLPPRQVGPQSSFFLEPWPATIPLSVPNVQVLDADCNPLETQQINQLAEDAGRRNGVSADLLKSVMHQESNFKPCALSVVGAMGLMQIMPETAETLSLDDPFDPVKNVDAGAKFLRMMLDRYQGDTQLALGAYNAGPGRVDKAGGVPDIPETIGYVNKVLAGLPEQH